MFFSKKNKRKDVLFSFLKHLVVGTPFDEYISHEYPNNNSYGHSDKIHVENGMPGSICSCSPVNDIVKGGKLIIRHKLKP